MKQKSKNAISIIGGADGPTSIFIAGHSKKQPLKIRIKNSIYRYKRKKVEKTIVANPHSLSETVQYAKDKYELTETAPADREYIEQIKCLKESLILQYEPELLGEMKDIPVPDFSNEASVKEYLVKIKTRSEMIAEMPDSIIPMDFHLYKIRIDDDFLEMEIDYTWNIFGMSYSGNNAVMKKFKKISRDLYSYWISVIRLPDFVNQKDFEWAVETATKKKKIDCSSAEFVFIDEGLCVQIMHLGAFDDEPATVALMDAYLEQNGYVNDMNMERLHHEIYLSDARKVAPEKWKTVIRHPIKKL